MNSPFLFHIADLRSGRSESRTFAAEVAVDWHVELSRVLPDPPLRFSFELSGVGGGIVVMGEIEASVRHRCHRCLTEWDEDIVRNVAQLVSSTADDEDDYHAVGDTFDFEDMVRDELLLDLPIAPLCGPDCKGLVDEAASGLNTDFSEDEVNDSSPFSVLKDLLDTGD
ncbi:MAG: YceD family protein [Actinomycetota bacterium]|nr:YceD family protein [Actinomycetota bacterium]